MLAAVTAVTLRVAVCVQDLDVLYSCREGMAAASGNGVMGLTNAALVFLDCINSCRKC